MYKSWAQIDSSTDGLTDDVNTGRENGGSSIARTVDHVTNMVDTITSLAELEWAALAL